MIRFRFREDEERYLALLSEAYRHIAVHLPPASVTAVMRNLGKMQDLLLLEGVRQGVASAAVSNIAGAVEGVSLDHLKAFQLHAHVYGSQDTPLRDVEREWTEKLLGNADHADAWLDPAPMRFAPETEQQIVAESAAAPPAPHREAGTGRNIQCLCDQAPVKECPKHGTPWLPPAEAAPDDVDVDAIESLLDEEPVQSEPDPLDRMRETLLGFAKSGIKPRDYQDLVWRLHITMQMDAGYIDVQLGTEEGRTVLAQAGFGDMHPGPWGLNLQELPDRHAGGEPADPTAVPPPPRDDYS